MVTAGQGSRFQERSARWLLLLTLLHTVPALWITPVAGGTVPAAVLLAVGVAGLFSFDHEGLALGLMALLPGLVYLGLAWGVAWLVARSLQHLARPWRLMLLAVLVAGLLAAVYFPIYIAGGHNASSSASLPELIEGSGYREVVSVYWFALHGVLALLFALQLPAQDAPLALALQRWARPVLAVATLVLVVSLLFTNFSRLVCRPLAHLGSDAAQLCVARSNSVEARYWYARAAADGNLEALVWLVDNTPDRRQRLELLQQGAAAGEGEMMYRLSEHLRRYGGPSAAAEVGQWLEAAAAAGHGPAQMALVEQMTAEVLRTQSRALLAERNARLEEAAANGSRLARLRLAEHYARGSMGYPVDLARARAGYEALAADGEGAPFPDRTQRMAGHSVSARLLELERWQAGLAAQDPVVRRELARLYLKSPLPGRGVRELGLELYEGLAAADPEVRRELIVMLRTGSEGADKDLEAARRWLLEAAEAQEVDAMERVAGNYMNGREGFPLDYPQARVWLEKLIEHHRRGGGEDAGARIADAEQKLRYLDRLGELAGGPLLGPAALERLGARGDAESEYRYAQQLLAGGGAARRDEALARLRAAAELGHGEAAWRLVWIYERGFPEEIDPAAARRELERAVQLHHFDATRELASRYEYGKQGYVQDLPRAIAMYEDALAAGRDNRYGWNLSQDNFNHFRWLESRLRQARLKAEAGLAGR